MTTLEFHSKVRRRASFHLWLANLAFGTVVGLNYLGHVPDVEGVRMWLFALPALLSSVLVLTLVPATLFYVAAHFVRAPGILGTVQASFWTLFQVLLFADTRIYNIFRYHFNGQVLNLVYTRGSEDAIHLGWQVWTAISIGLVSVVSVQTWVWRRSLRRAEVHFRGGPERMWLRPSVVWGLVLLPAVFLEKSIYARADLTRDRQVTQLARIFPLYARVPMEDLASKVLGVPKELPEPPVLEGLELDYPKHRPRIDPKGPRPNVLVIVIDCLRSDLVNEATMPAVSRWAEADALRFEDHLSGGNSTRYGLFSLLYGLHGSYWFPVLTEGRSPVLVDELLGLGYDFGIFGSASMNYPELRQTLWSRVNEDVHDSFDSPFPWRRDELAAEALIDWLREREQDDDPFFSFVLLDSPHQTYSHPPDDTPFEPSAPDLDYMGMTQNDGPEPELLEAVRNRYLNAVHHADDVAGRILAALDASSLADDTLVVVTGDHGEEFREAGFFGHTSAFTPWQVRVPFILRGPGIEPGTVDGPTSHLDFAPTLLELMGADPGEREQWTLGQNLFAPDKERRRVISGWNELGVWTPSGILRVPLSAFEFDLELYDYFWNPEVDDADVLRAEAETLEALGADCNRFLE